MSKFRKLAAVFAISVLSPACQASQRDVDNAVVASDVSVVPMQMSMGRPIVPVFINGKGPFPLILDTGAGGISVSRALADELGLEVTGQVETGSPIGDAPILVDEAQLSSIAIGDAQVPGRKVNIIPLPEDEMGVIGPDVFNRYGRFVLDFAAMQVEIGGVASDDPAINWIEFGPSKPLLDVPVTIGGVEIMTHLDTGAPQMLAVPMEWAEKLPLLDDVQKVGQASTIDKTFDIFAAPIDASMNFGNAEIPLSDIIFFDVPIANLGADAMAGLRIEYDFAGNRFAIVGSGAGAQERPQRTVVTTDDGAEVVAEGKPTFGVFLNPGAAGGKMEVAGTVSGSDAAKMGLKEGDIILAINGTPPSDMPIDNLRASLAAPELTLLVERDGVEIEMVK